MPGLSPRLACALLALPLALSGCGSGEPGGAEDGGPPDAAPPGPDADPNQSDPLFDPAHVVQIEIDMADADWDVMRNQTRTIFDILGGDCLGQPFPSPFTNFPANVTIDGTTVSNVGIRKKGFLGSLDPDKPGMKIKFDEYIAGQEYLGLERLTLNNARQDPSHIHTCLAYQSFTAAGIPAPRCNFAHVTVNGADLGIYANVESVDKTFLRRHFASDEGNLFEGTLSDFRADWDMTFDLKTNETANDRSAIAEMVGALGAPDSSLVDSLTPIMDLDGYYTFWAAEVLIGHWDGYASNTNNFFIYDDPTDGKIHFMPWGADAVFEPGVTYGQTGLTTVAAQGVLARRLYMFPETQAEYLARLDELLAGAWDEAALLAEVDRMHALIQPYVGTEPEWENAVDEVRIFINQRRSEIIAELAGGPRPWTDPLRDPPCLATVGDASGTFTTTWGTAGTPNPFLAGSGSMTITIDGVTVTPTPVGATSGFEDMPADPANPRATVTLLAPLGDGTYAVVVFVLAQQLFMPGMPSLDFNSLGIIYQYNPTTMMATLRGVLLGDGLTLTAASTTTGATVSGSFAMPVTRWPF
jgi:hypothetical protein